MKISVLYPSRAPWRHLLPVTRSYFTRFKELPHSRRVLIRICPWRFRGGGNFTRRRLANTVHGSIVPYLLRRRLSGATTQFNVYFCVYYLPKTIRRPPQGARTHGEQTQIWATKFDCEQTHDGQTNEWWQKCWERVS